MNNLYFFALWCSVTIFKSLSVLAKSPDWPQICGDIVTRQEWGAQTAIAVDYAIIPVKFVVVHHTASGECNSKDECSELVKNIQNFHINTMEFHDIGYNFLVGGDGRIYEGAGWHKVGAHTRGYNIRSLGLAFIGDYTNKLPNRKMLKAAKDFLQCAVELGELDKNYKLFGARQVSATLSPGNKLYNNLKQWSHFTSTP